MQSTTAEIIARVGNVAAKMEGELSAAGKLEFAKPWKAAIDADLAELRARFSRYQWRPISEIHEDYGDCVLVNILTDCGYIKIGSNVDMDWSESEWTHFARFAPIGQDEYLRMKAEADAARATESGEATA